MFKCATILLDLQTLCWAKEITHKTLHVTWFDLYEIRKINKYMGQTVISVCLAWGMWLWGKTLKHQASLWSNGNKKCCETKISYNFEYTNTTIHLKWVQYVEYELYLKIILKVFIV